MISENIIVIIGNIVFNQYLSLNITNDIYTVGGSLTLEGTSPLLASVEIGAVAIAQINGEGVFAGLVETVSITRNKDTRSVTVEATDILGALRRLQVSKFKTYKNRILSSIIRDVFSDIKSTVNINPVIKGDAAAIVIEEFSVERGESVAQILSSLCVNVGIVCTCDNSGVVEMNYLKGAESVTRHAVTVGKDLFKEVRYRISSVNSWKIVQAHKQGESVDAAKTAYGYDMYWLDRVPCFCPAADVKKTKETAVAKLNECRAAGFSYTITLAGARCGNGLIWQTNENCAVFDPELSQTVAGTYYINSRNISYSKDGGTVSTIGMSMVNLR